MVANARLEFVLVYTIPAAAKTAAVTDITAALQESALVPLPAVRFTLEQTAAAHDAVKNGAVGKVLDRHSTRVALSSSSARPLVRAETRPSR